MKTLFTIFAILGLTFSSMAQVDLGVQYANYSNNQIFANDTIKTEFIITNFGSTMYHTGDTLYVNAEINGMLFSLDLMSTNATPIVLTGMLHNGDTMHYDPGYLLGSATLAYLGMIGAPASTLDVCIIVWGKGLSSVSPSYGGDVNIPNNRTCVTHDPAFVTGIDNSKEISGVVVYPNPAINSINFEFLQNNIDKITIYDITGKIVKNVTVTKSLETIDIVGLGNGLYFYQVISSNGVVSSGKFVK